MTLDRADELAAEVVEVREEEEGPHYVVCVSNVPVYGTISGAEARIYVERLRPAIAAVIRRAAVEALSSGMPGTPLSVEELADMGLRASRAIHSVNTQSSQETHVSVGDLLRLLAHVAYLDGLLRDLSQDEAGAIYRRGVEDAAKITDRSWLHPALAKSIRALVPPQEGS